MKSQSKSGMKIIAFGTKVEATERETTTRKCVSVYASF